ncbi:MAG: PQQ-binding-like beta-propeller repeat protein [Vicinamibacterales bacterium]
MTRRSLSGCAFLLSIAIAAGRTLTSAQPPIPSIANGEWPSYHGDNRNHHYSPLAQINASNFNTLEVAWRLKTDNFGNRPEYKLEGTPLMVGGILYTTAGTRRAVIAIDAGTGEVLWIHGEPEGARGAAAPRQLSGRGVSYWTDGKDQRVLYVTPGFQLIALDARTGNRIPSFGKDGRVDLKAAAVFGRGQPIDLITGEIGLHATPAVANGVVIVGSAFREGHTPKTHDNTKGLVQAFDVRTGKRLWTFNTIPKPGEFGSETWENESWANNGNVGVWNQMAIDEELGLVYLPVETPSSDFYGGHRPGNNLFAESLVAIELKTGKRRWHFQLVHHPIWNMDISSAPILEDITVGGKPIKAVSIMGKQAMVYVFDRATGQPVWPIEERPVPQSDVPGEKTSPTQPFPTRPPPYDHQGVTAESLIDFTPALHAEALQLMSKYKMGPIFTPTVISKADGPIASFRSSGGTNWPGGAFDPETQVLYVPSYTSLVPVGLLPPPNTEFSDIRYVLGNAVTGVRYIMGPGENAGADAPPPPRGTTPGLGGEVAGANPPTPQGLPYLKPPYGRITAIDMTKGEFIWQVPHGETPDIVRNHPALKGVTIPRTGQAGAVGVLVTKTLAIAGDPVPTTAAGRPRGAMLRAYDKASGKELGAVYMPAQQSGSPMTYMHKGRQFIIVAVSGGNYSGEYIAFALPAN